MFFGLITKWTNGNTKKTVISEFKNGREITL
jgi:hypothetical protein